MSNLEKRWSWGVAFGRGTGGAVGAGVAGAFFGVLGGPVGAVGGAAIGAAGGFVGGFVGTVLGHWWDDPFDQPEPFISAALYTLITCGTFASILNAIILGFITLHPDRSVIAIGGVSLLSGFFSAASRSLIDDFRAAAKKKREAY